MNERKKDYALHNQTVKWIIDSQECIEMKFGERRILEFKTEWLFQSFLDYDEVYYDITRGNKMVNLFDMYYDKFGDGLKSINWTHGRVNPRVWGYKAPEKKKRK